jgi:hypothetical protein
MGAGINIAKQPLTSQLATKAISDLFHTICENARVLRAAGRKLDGSRDAKVDWNEL